MRTLAALLAAALLCAPGPQLAAQTPTRIVAVGDIHGAIDEFARILVAAGLTDATGRWTGGRTHFIQTGDYTDRGVGTRAVLDLLMTLEPQARQAGGRAVSLLGNHEVMNLIGDTRDVTPAIFATFADAKSEARRQEAWKQHETIARARTAEGLPVPPVYAQTREAWLATHPPGYVEYREAMSPRGPYGKWLRDKDVVLQHDGTIFMHAGLAPNTAPAKLNEVNTRVRDEVRRLDRFLERLVDEKRALPFFTLQEVLQVASFEITAANAVIDAAKAAGKEPDRSKLNLPLLLEAQEILKIDRWAVVAGEGPLWYRGLATLPDDPTGGALAPLLSRYGARRFVTAHTPQPDRRITMRFGGRVLLIDTGMLAAYQGRPAALEIVGDGLTAIYEDGRVPLAVSSQATVSRRPSSRPTRGR